MAMINNTNNNNTNNNNKRYLFTITLYKYVHVIFTRVDCIPRRIPESLDIERRHMAR